MLTEVLFTREGGGLRLAGGPACWPCMQQCGKCSSAVRDSGNMHAAAPQALVLPSKPTRHLWFLGMQGLQHRRA